MAAEHAYSTAWSKWRQRTITKSIAHDAPQGVVEERIDGLHGLPFGRSGNKGMRSWRRSRQLNRALLKNKRYQQMCSDPRLQPPRGTTPLICVVNNGLRDVSGAWYRVAGKTHPMHKQEIGVTSSRRVRSDGVHFSLLGKIALRVGMHPYRSERFSEKSGRPHRKP